MYDPGIDGDEATSTMLSNSFFSIGMDSLVGIKKSFINFTESLLVHKLSLLLPKESSVIEILENVNPTTELVTACQEMAQNGYGFALDDFTYTPDLRPLIDLAQIIKFDFRLSSTKVETLISPDMSLSYKLLRYINSAFFAKAQRISSIQQALVNMGEAKIRRFASLIAMSNLAKGKPGELIRVACIRGKFCTDCYTSCLVRY